MFKSLVAVAVVTFAAPLAFAAVASSTDGRVNINAGGAGVIGTVVDASGVPVVGAEVSVRNVTRGAKTFDIGKSGRLGAFDVSTTAKRGDRVEVVVTWTDAKGTLRRVTGTVTL